MVEWWTNDKKSTTLFNGGSGVKSLTQERFNYIFDRVISYVLNVDLLAALLITALAS